MKKGAKIALGILGAVVVTGAALTAWQWSNIKAAAYMLSMDRDTLDQRLEENQHALDDAMASYQVGGYTFSEDEISRLKDGSLTPEEAARQMLDSMDAPSKESPEPSVPQTSAAGQSPEAASAAVPADDVAAEAEAEIREKIATMYALRTTYVGKLEAVVQSAIDEYAAGEHTSENRTKVVYSKFEELTALEQECDQQVAAVVARLRELLKITGQDDSLAKLVEQTYEDQKSLKKAYYLQEFQSG